MSEHDEFPAELVERVARAIRKASNDPWEWDDASPKERAEYRAQARAALRALRDAGALVGPDQVAVPREATKRMRDAAHHALYQWREANGDPQQDPTNDQKHGIRWAAMVKAYEQESARSAQPENPPPHSRGDAGKSHGAQRPNRLNACEEDQAQNVAAAPRAGGGDE